jgi:hypothetical protein
MIQGVHASSVVFADFAAASADLLEKLSRRFPAIGMAGHPLGIRGAEFRVRLGSVRNEKRAYGATLTLESNRAPFQTQLIGTLTLRQETGSRTSVDFEGKCSRNFNGMSSTASTEAVRHQANDFCRTLLDMLVNAIEGSLADAPLRPKATRLPKSVGQVAHTRPKVATTHAG